MTDLTNSTVKRNRAAVAAELRRLLPGIAHSRAAPSFPLGLAAIDRCLPPAGLPCGLHEVVPEQEAAPCAFGFMVALLARFFSPPALRGRERIDRRSIIIVLPASRRRADGRLHGHGVRAFGLDPRRLILVATAHRTETLWAMEEALRSGAPAAVAGVIERLDLRCSQRLQLAAIDAGLPLFVLRPAQLLEASAAATRWRVAPAPAARDRFGLILRPRWRLMLERCRNGRAGEWVVEYDHVAHCFSLAAALADPAPARGAGEKSFRHAS